MATAVRIEDIEELRQGQGIDDVELRHEVARLAVGDVVLLTLVGTSALARETLPARITSIRGAAFRGKLVRGPACVALSALRAGSIVAFTGAQIHSILLPARAVPAPHALSSRGPRAEGVPVTTPKGEARPAPWDPAEPLRRGHLLTPLSTQERLERIAALGQRVSRAVEFMCQAASLTGASAEAKEQAVIDFYEKLLALEGQLSRVAEGLRLA
jgi:hypothetical protein